MLRVPANLKSIRLHNRGVQHCSADILGLLLSTPTPVVPPPNRTQFHSPSCTIQGTCSPGVVGACFFSSSSIQRLVPIHRAHILHRGGVPARCLCQVGRQPAGCVRHGINDQDCDVITEALGLQGCLNLQQGLQSCMTRPHIWCKGFEAYE